MNRRTSAAFEIRSATKHETTKRSPGIISCFRDFVADARCVVVSFVLNNVSATML